MQSLELNLSDQTSAANINETFSPASDNHYLELYMTREDYLLSKLENLEEEIFLLEKQEMNSLFENSTKRKIILYLKRCIKKIDQLFSKVGYLDKKTAHTILNNIEYKIKRLKRQITIFNRFLLTANQEIIIC